MATMSNRKDNRLKKEPYEYYREYYNPTFDPTSLSLEIPGDILTRAWVARSFVAEQSQGIRDAKDNTSHDERQYKDFLKVTRETVCPFPPPPSTNDCDKQRGEYKSIRNHINKNRIKLTNHLNAKWQTWKIMDDNDSEDYDEEEEEDGEEDGDADGEYDDDDGDDGDEDGDDEEEDDDDEEVEEEEEDDDHEEEEQEDDDDTTTDTTTPPKKKKKSVRFAEHVTIHYVMDLRRGKHHHQLWWQVGELASGGQSNPQYGTPSNPACMGTISSHQLVDLLYPAQNPKVPNTNARPQDGLEAPPVQPDPERSGPKCLFPVNSASTCMARSQRHVDPVNPAQNPKVPFPNVGSHGGLKAPPVQTMAPDTTSKKSRGMNASMGVTTNPEPKKKALPCAGPRGEYSRQYWMSFRKRLLDTHQPDVGTYLPVAQHELFPTHMQMCNPYSLLHLQFVRCGEEKLVVRGILAFPEDDELILKAAEKCAAHRIPAYMNRYDYVRNAIVTYTNVYWTAWIRRNSKEFERVVAAVSCGAKEKLESAMDKPTSHREALDDLTVNLCSERYNNGAKETPQKLCCASENEEEEIEYLDIPAELGPASGNPLFVLGPTTRPRRGYPRRDARGKRRCYRFRHVILRRKVDQSRLGTEGAPPTSMLIKGISASGLCSTKEASQTSEQENSTRSTFLNEESLTTKNESSATLQPAQRELLSCANDRDFISVAKPEQKKLVNPSQPSDQGSSSASVQNEVSTTFQSAPHSCTVDQAPVLPSVSSLADLGLIKIIAGHLDNLGQIAPTSMAAKEGTSCYCLFVKGNATTSTMFFSFGEEAPADEIFGRHFVKILDPDMDVCPTKFPVYLLVGRTESEWRGCVWAAGRVMQEQHGTIHYWSVPDEDPKNYVYRVFSKSADSPPSPQFQTAAVEVTDAAAVTDSSALADVSVASTSAGSGPTRDRQHGR